MSLEVVATELGKFIVRAVGVHLTNRPRLRSAKHTDHELAISASAQDAIGWASNIQILGMQSPKNPLSEAIPLRISLNQRRYQSPSGLQELTENDLANSSDNILLLGDPGSGKTTTLKRLTQSLILAESEEDQFSTIPIVIRLRDLATNESLTAAIARRLGLAVTRRQTLEIEGEWNPEKHKKKTSPEEYWIGDIRALEAILGFFTEQNVFLAIDGLDEYSGDRRLLHREINQLAASSQRLKIALSSRVGDYAGGLLGFCVYQICPLSSDEVHKIAQIHLEKFEPFLHALYDTPYKDLADRPLFLMQLILIYRQYGNLPYQPTEVYPIVVDLVLRDWDVDQNVIRRSRYSGFTSSRKLKFLAALSFQLLIKRHSRVFTSRDLEFAYEMVRLKFDLPSDEATQVVQEIESHSGLLIGAAAGRFEFCHLSIQEYLAADYMSRETRGSNLRSYISEYPATVAVAIALSSDPGDTLATLVFDGMLKQRNTVSALLARLIVERPTFEPSRVLGAATLELLSFHFEALSQLGILLKYLDLQGLKESVSAALDDYVAQGSSHQLILIRASTKKTLGNIPTPERIVISRDILHSIMKVTGGMPTAYTSGKNN